MLAQISIWDNGQVTWFWLNSCYNLKISKNQKAYLKSNCLHKSGTYLLYSNIHYYQDSLTFSQLCDRHILVFRILRNIKHKKIHVMKQKKQQIAKAQYSVKKTS